MGNALSAGLSDKRLYVHGGFGSESQNARQCLWPISRLTLRHQRLLYQCNSHSKAPAKKSGAALTLRIASFVCSTEDIIQSVDVQNVLRRKRPYSLGLQPSSRSAQILTPCLSAASVATTISGGADRLQRLCYLLAPVTWLDASRYDECDCRYLHACIYCEANSKTSIATTNCLPNCVLYMRRREILGR
jgi:hypothetical protein